MPTGFVESVVASGVTRAMTMAFAPDGKLFVLGQSGPTSVWKDGALVQANFFRDAPLPLQTSYERGLLGIAFDPNYAASRSVYVYYTTNDADAHNRVSRFTANANGDGALPGSEDVILELDPHLADFHHGGAMHFGADGLLYIATGDNANGALSQSLENRHGKMLRVDVTGDDFPADASHDYRIPADQPTTFGGLAGTTSGLNRAIWAVGLRNPFTFAVQPGTGRIFINDVGQAVWEEINEGGPGRNYGWPTTEGAFDAATYPGFTRPVYAYDHNGAEPNGVAITGGAFYDPAVGQFPAEYAGDYFFVDHGSGEIWSLDLATMTATEFAAGVSAAVALAVDDAGHLYYCARGTGKVFKVAYAPADAPSITDAPDPTAATIGTSATFDVVASGAEPLSYQWQRAEAGTTDFADVAGATQASHTLADVQAPDDGAQFRVVVTVAFGRSTASTPATLTAAANLPPSATISITGGLRDGRFDAGRAITFTGGATDPEDGPLGPGSLTWKVEYLTTINGGDVDKDGLPGLTRPFLAPFSGVTGGTFTPATTGPYTLTDVAHLITLVATDAAGRTDVERYVIEPNLVVLKLATNPNGMQLTIDGQPFTATRSVPSVVGFRRPIGTATTQSLDGTEYTFQSWSDAGAATHTIVTPGVYRTYTATFQAVVPPFAAKVNFQDATSQGHPGYLADTGKVFADRGGGLAYGWDLDNSAFARNGNRYWSLDERYDTFNRIQAIGGARKWEIAVPNGTYGVRLVCGENGGKDQINTVTLEGTVLTDPDGNDHYDEYAVNVTVSDGRLTITPAAGGVNAKVAFVDVGAPFGPPPPPPPPDTAAPTVVARTPAPGAIASGTSLNVDVAFSEAVSNVDMSDLSISGNAVNYTTTKRANPVHLGNNVWRFAITALNPGALNIWLAPDANDIEDLAGNDLASLKWSYTMTA